jgi:hypothetical protein
VRLTAVKASGPSILDSRVGRSSGLLRLLTALADKPPGAPVSKPDRPPGGTCEKSSSQRFLPGEFW